MDKDPNAIQYSSLNNQPEIILYGLKKDKHIISHVVINNDIELCEKILNIQPSLYSRFTEFIRNNYNISFIALISYKENFKYLPIQIKYNPNFWIGICEECYENFDDNESSDEDSNHSSNVSNSSNTNRGTCIEYMNYIPDDLINCTTAYHYNTPVSARNITIVNFIATLMKFDIRIYNRIKVDDILVDESINAILLTNNVNYRFLHIFKRKQYLLESKSIYAIIRPAIEEENNIKDMCKNDLNIDYKEQKILTFNDVYNGTIN